MHRLLWFTAVSLLVPVSLAAQSAEQDIRQAVEGANKAALAHNIEAYARFLADDLIWLAPTGNIISKPERLKAIVAPPNPRTMGEIERVQVYGDTAILVANATRADGSRRRLVRTLVKRDGRWQLVLHAEADAR
jgi:ketosteroid isomerase-like protein